MKMQEKKKKKTAHWPNFAWITCLFSHLSPVKHKIDIVKWSSSKEATQVHTVY